VNPRASFARLCVELAGVAVVLVALHFAAPVFNPVFFALVLALVFDPLYAKLRAKRIPTLGALAIMFVGIVVACGALAWLMAYSVSGLMARLDTYAANWSQQLAQIDAWLQSIGIANVSLATLLSPDAMLSLFGALIGVALSAASQVVFVVILLLFFLAEGAAIVHRVRETVGDVTSLVTYGTSISRYFILRAAVNAVTGAGVTIVLLLLGVDFPVLWGVLTFFLSFIPYIGMFLASVPSVLLAFAEFDLARALLVVIALTLVNALAENLVQPALMSRGLHLSPTLVFLSVVFWSFVLGGGGSFLAVPLSLGVLTIASRFVSTRWLTAAGTVK
jgi:predicted PurR-regulated permease PerM